VKRAAVYTLLLFMQLSFISMAVAGDFDWLSNLNLKAEADSSGYRIKLATRFNIGDSEVKVVLGKVDSPSDAYMILRLGELSNRPVDEVMNVYRANRKKGWGVIAKSLGIKPGSSEFHALKRGHDLDYSMGNENRHSSGHHKNRGKKQG